MKPKILLLVILSYFCVLVIISLFTGKNSTNFSFFLGNRQSPWYIVAFGMIGASLSGVTFISIPGEVGHSEFSYMQIVFGYLFGYIVIANILMPIYYKLNLTSIYTYLKQRFGIVSYKTGSVFFIFSRVIGASFRLFLVAIVLDKFILNAWSVPFWLTVAITILFIWIYSFRSGIKTIVWTDTLQTLFMILAVVFSLIFIMKEMNLSTSGLINSIVESRYSKIFIWDWHPRNNFFKHFFSGIFITIVMTGLDQDMMQKNLSCRNLKEAKKNMYWMSSSLILVNLLFLSLGAALYLFANSKGIIHENFQIEHIEANCRVSLLSPVTNNMECNSTDQLFPFLAVNHLPAIAVFTFAIGLIAAAYSSADSALTALTTAFCVDFLGVSEINSSPKKRYFVHIGFSVLIFLVIILFKILNNDSVINSLFQLAGYTYGPLLGLYAFGIFTKKIVRDKFVFLVALISPMLSYLIYLFTPKLIPGYKIGFELLIINGFLTFMGLLFITKRKAY